MTSYVFCDVIALMTSDISINNAFYFQVDMSAFEEIFKTKAQDTEADRRRLERLAEAQQKRGNSVIDVTRARNLGKITCIFYIQHSLL